MGSENPQTLSDDNVSERVGFEKSVASLLVVIAFVRPGFQYPLYVVAAGIGLPAVFIFRRQAVNNPLTDESRVMLYLNPLLEIFSIVLAVDAIARFTHWVPVSEKIPAFILITTLIGLSLIYVQETLLHDYFEWWADRFIEKAGDAENSLWAFTSVKARELSKASNSQSEIRRMRSRFRGNMHLYLENYDFSFQWAWIWTFAKEALKPGRLLAITVGIILFNLGPEPDISVSSVLLSTGIVLSTSLIGDHLKYWYMHRGNTSIIAHPEKQRDHLFLELRRHYVASVISVVLVWSTLYTG